MAKAESGNYLKRTMAGMLMLPAMLVPVISVYNFLLSSIRSMKTAMKHGNANRTMLRFFGLVLAASPSLVPYTIAAQTAITADGTIESTSDGFKFPDGTVQTTAGISDMMRSFYLRSSPISHPNMAPSVCAPGYHMASIWEILDVSNLRYAINHPDALVRSGLDDQGDGPPSNVDGWVRTGYFKTTADDHIPGRATCDGWTSDSAELNGTSAALETNWTTSASVVSPWRVKVVACSISSWRVWCVED